METVGLAESLATVAGASIAVATLVEATKRILGIWDQWVPRYGEGIAALYGLIGLPIYTTVVHGYDPVALVLAIVVGAQAGVAAGAGYDAVSTAVSKAAVGDG